MRRPTVGLCLWRLLILATYRGGLPKVGNAFRWCFVTPPAAFHAVARCYVRGLHVKEGG